MRILVLSDSHYTSLKNIDFKSYDAVIHCGDYGFQKELLIQNQVQFVRGNCDDYGLKHLVLELFGRKAFVTHGDIENVKYGLDRLVYRAMEYEVSVCFYGHTHQQKAFIEKDILFLNPGSFPKSYAEITEEAILLHNDEEVVTLDFKW